MIKGISIITPHYNCLDGLLHLESCLQSQTSGFWDWIIVDDSSDFRVQEEAQKHFNNQEKITFYTNLEKSNAS
ncbi:MAG: glycosyltransferase family A protein, partial [Flavobacterium sp.]